MMDQMANTMQQIPRTIFSVDCGEIRPKDDGIRVKISGKVVKRPRTARFLEIKDFKGCTQLVATDDKPEIGMKFQSIPHEAFVTVIGTVQLRPNNFCNKASYSVPNIFGSLKFSYFLFSQSQPARVKLPSKNSAELFCQFSQKRDLLTSSNVHFQHPQNRLVESQVSNIKKRRQKTLSSIL